MTRSSPALTLADLHAACTHLAAQTYRGVAGVAVLESGQPGPTVGITVMTHGNEPSGLAAYHALVRQGDLMGRMQRGRVMFVLNNPAAAARYFALPADAPLEAKLATRGLDLNMNRLPADVMSQPPTQAEVARVQELRPIWAEFDVGLDVHSTSLPSEPMVVGLPTLKPELIRGFPIEVVLGGIGTVMRDKPAMAFYGAPGRAHLLVETGSHEEPLAFTRAIRCAEALLENLGVLPAPATPAAARTYRHYEVTSSLFFPDESYRTVEIFPNFAPITAGQVLARGDGPDLTAPHDGHALMCFASGRPPSLREEALFMAQPVQTLSL